MAKIIRGQHKGNTVVIADIDGEYAVLDNMHTIKLGMLEVTSWERETILSNYASSDTFKVHYELEHFISTNRFKKIHWARV